MESGSSGDDVPELLPEDVAKPDTIAFQSPHEGNKDPDMNTLIFMRSAADGMLRLDWVNKALRKGGEQPSTATGTWPFLVFMSFTALCIWFQSPFYPKSVHLDCDLTWIFTAHKEGDMKAPYDKWDLFCNHFETKIIAKLDPYFKCNAITDLLKTMRDLCIPSSWGDETDTTPTGFTWPHNVPRVTHEQMIEAVERAIVTLLQDAGRADAQGEVKTDFRIRRVHDYVDEPLPGIVAQKPK
ncbi:hypothetical protein DEU56DRAFT_911630 [Suillus clintonianus]|uniref:uncharacterized protein n=1 Tax=Suillus clintonianus TaxID=1904413 RepID=UPI001B87E47C|nr:uncharacterized protein DEU56DRAFT_911630 [Suillus clintonianus]KAG2140563.1 hypothetical protein DEU56DRAFT_911630 [Suillus clintonianus]